MMNPDFAPEERQELTQFLFEELEKIYASPESLKSTANPHVELIKKRVRQFNFNKENNPKEVLADMVSGLKEYTVHTTHPGYMGLYNPRANFVSVLADYMTAIFNPQLAAWSHAPFANEIERYLIEEFGRKFGYPKDLIDGTFCSGGAESNLTAILCALTEHFPEYQTNGLNSLSNQPIIYCSSEAHHSIVKAAKITGLGSNAVKAIPVNENLAINLTILTEEIKKDKKKGDVPFMVVGTAGTTGAGAIDNLEVLGEICQKNHLWYHVDAAYGGAILTSPKYRQFLNGIEKSNSITLDIHKWFSVPMGTSIFLTSNKTILHQAFGINTSYMPEKGVQSIDPYTHSIQWSRRFMGLKVYLPLAVFGWDGYGKIIENQINTGFKLREILLKEGWSVLNQTDLPVICFSHKDLTDNNQVEKLAAAVVNTGKAWISTYPIQGRLTLRACITNYATQTKDLLDLMELLKEYKEKI